MTRKAVGGVVDMQRILLVIPSMTGGGGTERMVHSLSSLLAEGGREVSLATFDTPGAPQHFDIHVPLHPLGPIPRLPLPLRPISYILAASRLRRLKKGLKIDITISNLWSADLINVLSAGRDRKIALCHINIRGNRANTLMERLRPFVAAIYQQFDRVIAVSEALAQELKALYWLPVRRISHIENFVDRPETTSSLPTDGIQRFVFCGRLSPEKNVEGLLRTWAGFVANRSRVQLIILGDGPLRDALAQLARELGLQVGNVISDTATQVIFTGRVSDPSGYMLGARALLLTSNAEGLPMAILEALSLGLPVLAADCRAGGVRAALQGYGKCNPNLDHAEYTPAGALLPVPSGLDPASLAVWRDVLTNVSENDEQWASWREGALIRATHFSSEAVRNRWLRAIDFQGAGQ